MKLFRPFEVLRNKNGDNMEKMYWVSTVSGVGGELYNAVPGCTSLLCSTLTQHLTPVL